ncbi:hypothetical protein LSTR_LSTR000427 [Laodelphax striatellus]|uniref:Uncharacterized protein n=1 Tax=Laodelphax striatellus TaxID=195883 RepID=A0A482X4V6_LAOST|nr:hypothetical protein LSTR_LSTR000427 [Laodelphax striatellus]
MSEDLPVVRQKPLVPHEMTLAELQKDAEVFVDNVLQEAAKDISKSGLAQNKVHEKKATTSKYFKMRLSAKKNSPL